MKKKHAVIPNANVAMRGVVKYVSQGNPVRVDVTAIVVRRDLVAVAKIDSIENTKIKNPGKSGVFYYKLVNDILRLFIISLRLILMR
ncbi:MAG: hypothetical protein QF769_05685 [Candidatus Marinimicrobia bacterium]|jgi:hypothetical protein|nr:hypothetical protein [Candidatus Neomarinimicrobiota bacterium]